MHLSASIIVSKADTEIVYNFLKQKQCLDIEKKPNRIEDGFLAIAINSQCPTIEEEIQIYNADQLIKIRFADVAFEANPPSQQPHARMRQYISQWLEENLSPSDAIENSSNQKLIAQLLAEIPLKWEKLGDLILLPQTAFSSEKWSSLITQQNQISLWKNIAEALKVERIGRQKFINNDVVRSSQAQLLLGESSWVELVDFGVEFGFDACKVMYSSGNITERHRIGNIDMKGQTIVDCYAGIGYYTLPMLVRSGAATVHACEINPDSIKALQWGAKANNVAEKLIIHQGDNALTLTKLQGIADRCHLGLLPSSQPVWKLAIGCLKPQGGILHIHMNVEEEKIQTWTQSTIETLNQFATELEREYQVEVIHLEKVKWFAPRVRHVVLDVVFTRR